MGVWTWVRLTISPSGGQLIDGFVSYDLEILNEAVMFVTDGANWYKF